ncbi:MAG: ATP-binding protein [Anaerolineae bacterium]
MPAWFWLDVGAYVLVTLIAFTLTLAVFGTGPGRRLNQLFAFYTLTTACTAVLATLLRLALWLERGTPEVLGQLGTWTFSFIGPALLLFAVHYLEVSARPVHLAAFAGIVWGFVFLLPASLLGAIVYGHRLTPNGTTHVSFTLLGTLSTLVPVIFLIWALVLFWLLRRRVNEVYLAFSTVALLVGILVGGLLDVPFPVLSFSMLLSLVIVGHGIMTRQFFNPLRERNLALQREVRERQRAEAEILRLQHLLAAIADSMPSALITLDLDGNILTWNPAAEALTGRSAPSVLGTCCWDACPALVRYRDLVEEASRTSSPVRRERESVHTDGQTITYDVEVFPLLTDGVQGMVLRIEDVTPRVQMEEVALQTAKMASIGRLVAGMAHELNNPLGGILQGTQIVRLVLDGERDRTREAMIGSGLDPQAVASYLADRDALAYLDSIQVAGQRAAKIVRDLLGFSRRSVFEPAPHDINDLLRITLDLAAADYDLRKRYDFRDIDIVLHLADDLPPVVCDAPQIQQVILNLVQNAAQAMARRAALEKEVGNAYAPVLTVRTSLAGEAVRLEVTDSGPGLPEDILPHLFEPFTTTKDVGMGTGLGLWLSWMIVVEHHRGKIWGERAEGEGATFVVELPL